MQYILKIKGQEYHVSGKKAEVQNLSDKINMAVKLNHHYKELSGVTGQKEHSCTFWSPFTTVEIQDKEGYEKEIAELLPMIEGAKIAQFPAIIDKALEIYKKYLPIVDNRRTPEEETIRQQELEADRIKREEKARVKAEEDRQEEQKLLAKYPYLITVTQSRLSSHALASKNIKTELTRQWPGHKFSVTSDSFSGGDSVHVEWIDGPTSEEVKDIIGKYQKGSFDGMTDSYDYNHAVFPAVFGGAKFVQEQREVSKSHIIEVAKEMGFNIIFDDNRHKWEPEGISYDDYKHVTNEAYSRSYYTPPATPDLPPTPDDDKPTVTLNEERNGVEIRFPGKPDGSILSTLKAHGFRWSKFQKMWYARQNEDTLAIAESLTA